jgi:RHS repeat-associated protein
MSTKPHHNYKHLVFISFAIIFIFNLLIFSNLSAESKIPKVRLSVKPLDLSRTPTTNELMAAGQLGGQLYPTNETKDKEKGKKMNLSFGKAIQEWNNHEYKKAIKMFKKHVEDYPDSPWAAEAILHVGCDARYNGRYTEAEEQFTWIIKKNKNKEHYGARMLLNKARSRFAVLKVLQSNFKEATSLFNKLKQESPDWRHRTYASHWIQRISRYKADELALLNCGTQALAHLLRKQGRNAESIEIAEMLPSSLKGHSIKDLISIAEKYGYNVEGLKLSATDLKSAPLPAIVQINGKNEGNRGHYWVIEKLENDELTMYDSQSGRRYHQSIDEFSKEWNGNALVFSNKETLPGISLSKKEMEDTYGACCGIQRPQDDLGCPIDNKGLGTGGSKVCCSSKGSPKWSVNMVTMNLYMTDTPLWYDPPKGPPVRIKLSYNSESALTQSEPFGQKWMFNYGSYITEDTGGNLVVYMPDGRQDQYVPDGQGGYTRPFGIFNKLTKISKDNYELEFPDGTVYEYDLPIRKANQPFLVGIRDAYGQKLTFEYNNQVQLITIYDALSRATTITYNADNLIEQINDPFGRFARFEYHPADLSLKRIEDMKGYWTEFTYDTTFYLTSLQNAKGTWVFNIETAGGVNDEVIYPAPGTPMWENYRITVTNPLNRKEEFYYYAFKGSKSWYVSPRDYVAYQNTYNNNYANAPKTFYSFYSSLYDKPRISRITYPTGKFVSFTSYDAATGKPGRVRDSHSPYHDKLYTYNSNGRVLTYEDAKGNKTTYTYYANNFDVQEIKFDKSSTPGDDGIILKNFTYHSHNGNDTHDIKTVTEVPASLNVTTEYFYNSNGQLTSTVQAQGSSIQMTTDYIYDAGTHELTEIRKDGSTITSFTYDNISRIKTVTDPNGFELTYWEYDALDRPTKITYPDTVFDGGNNPTSKFKNINYSLYTPGIIDSETDRAGLTTSYEYDALNRLIKVQKPDGIIKYEYDANGNRTKLIDADNKETQFEYTLDNNLSKKIYMDGKFIKYEYDKSGLLTKFTNSRNIEKEYSYDENHNLTSRDYSDSTPDVILTYDDYDRLDTMTDGIGVFDYGYDDLGRLSSIDGPWTDDTISFQYNELGQLKTLTPQNGQSITYYYDYDPENPVDIGIGRLKDIEVGSGSGNKYTYGYTGVNRLILSLTRPNGSYTEYLYNNPLKKLTDIINKDSSGQIISSNSFTYNNLDLIDAETVETGAALSAFTEGLKEYDYNNLNQLLSSANPSEAFEYDDDGNMTKGYTPDGYEVLMSYDAENRLKSAEYTDSGSVTQRIEYFYSGNNFLAEIKKFENGALVSDERLVRKGLLPIQERDDNNQVMRKYTWGQAKGGGIGGLLNLYQGGEDYSYLYDGKGNVMALLDNNQQIAASYGYDSFGVIKAKTVTLNQPYMFSTKQYDDATGLSYYGYRYYSPTLGRWITRDPLGESGGINLYGFVGNCPVNFVDPFGLETELCIRPFYPFPPPYARHCFVRFNGDNNDTLSFDTEGVHPDPAPDWWPKSCQSTEGKQDDDCVRREMNKCSADQYDFTGFNCCHCAEQAMKPGPQPGEPGYKP